MKNNKGISYLEIIFSILILSILGLAIFRIDSSNMRLAHKSSKISNIAHEIFNYLECFDSYRENPVVLKNIKLEEQEDEKYKIIYLSSKYRKSFDFVYLKRKYE